MSPNVNHFELVVLSLLHNLIVTLIRIAMSNRTVLIKSLDIEEAAEDAADGWNRFKNYIKI